MIIGIVLIIGVLLYFNSKKKYNTDLETINPPMTKKERKALMFYRKTKCNWGRDSSHDVLDGTLEQISDKEYIEYLRSISKSKD